MDDPGRNLFPVRELLRRLRTCGDAAKAGRQWMSNSPPPDQLGITFGRCQQAHSISLGSGLFHDLRGA